MQIKGGLQHTTQSMYAKDVVSPDGHGSFLARQRI